MPEVTIQNIVHLKKAFRYTKDDIQGLLEFIRKYDVTYRYVVMDSNGPDDTQTSSLAIQTLEGWYEVPLGWWIIIGIAKEAYPCEHKIFERSYVILPE